MKQDQLLERLVELYLRLNGYFTTGFIVHSKRKGRVAAQIDCLAVRHPWHEECGLRPCERLSPPRDRTDLLVCEVKSDGNAWFNGPLLKQPLLEAVLQRTGLIPPSEVAGVGRELLTKIRDARRSGRGVEPVMRESLQIRGVLFAPFVRTDPLKIGQDVLLRFIHDRLSPTAPRLNCATVYGPDQWGESFEELVRYFKERKTRGTTTSFVGSVLASYHKRWLARLEALGAIPTGRSSPRRESKRSRARVGKLP